MKGTGIVRKVDNLGRIVIPKEIRTQLDIVSSTDRTKCSTLEIHVEGSSVVLTKLTGKVCCNCGTSKQVNKFGNIYLCPSCLKFVVSESRRWR